MRSLPQTATSFEGSASTLSAQERATTLRAADARVGGKRRLSSGVDLEDAALGVLHPAGAFVEGEEARFVVGVEPLASETSRNPPATHAAWL